MALFTFTSVVQVLDYVDKNHMNNHYFPALTYINKKIKEIKKTKKITIIKK